jgi:hypothetical protein
MTPSLQNFQWRGIGNDLNRYRYNIITLYLFVCLLE